MGRPPKLRTGDTQGSKTPSDALWNLEINFLGCCEGLDRLGMHPHAWAFCPASCQDFTLLPEKNHVLQEFQIFLKRFIFVVGVSFLLHCSDHRYLFGFSFPPCHSKPWPVSENLQNGCFPTRDAQDRPNRVFKGHLKEEPHDFPIPPPRFLSGGLRTICEHFSHLTWTFNS